MAVKWIGDVARELGLDVLDAVEFLATKGDYPMNGLLDEERVQFLKLGKAGGRMESTNPVGVPVPVVEEKPGRRGGKGDRSGADKAAADKAAADKAAAEKASAEKAAAENVDDEKTAAGAADAAAAAAAATAAAEAAGVTGPIAVIRDKAEDRTVIIHNPMQQIGSGS